jgi:hypothetical protein
LLSMTIFEIGKQFSQKYHQKKLFSRLILFVIDDYF